MRRRALLIGVPGRGINVTLAAERLTPLLSGLGFDITRCVGSRANRDNVLRAIDRLVGQTGPDDTCFIHYFGHGGRIEFEDLDGPFAGTVFGFVSTFKETRGAGGFSAVLDLELSERFTKLDELCANVTVMLDCCYSAELVRATEDVALSSHYKVATPDLIREVLAAPRAPLALESHPRIVRLCGASAKREAYAALRQGLNIGHMTDSLLEILERLSPADAARVCWGAIVHELRERVIARLRFEGQWVALAGPRNRLMFSREQCEMPGTVAFVAKLDEPGWGWLRAGWQAGVAVGDRWAVLDLCVDEAGRPRVVVEGVVREVERNQAKLELDGAPALPIGSPACPARVTDSLALQLDGELGEGLEPSAWLRVVDGEAGAQAEARLRRDAEGVEGVVLEDLTGALPGVALADREGARALLEHRARVRAVLRSLAAREPDPCPLRWSCWQIGPDPGAALEQGAALRVGDRIRVEVVHEEDLDAPYNWFFSAVLIEADGRPQLLNARMPEGLELCPNEREVIGVRRGREDQGFELRWPAGVRADAAPISVLFLASQRPLQLAHVVREQPLDEDEALGLSGMFDALRQQAPTSSPACAWARLELVLRRE